jgi:membrane protein insertase Oxa1/YidC/SpoIIIJ
MNYKSFSLLLGFAIWLLATIAFRVAGHYFFLTDNLAVLTGLYIFVVPFLGLIANWLFNKFKLTKMEAVQSASLMVLPGMIFDTFCIQFF